MKNIRLLILSAVALAAVLSFAPQLAQAADAAAEPTSVVTSAATTTTPWYADGAVIGAVIAAVTSLLAIWQHGEKKTAQKVSESLVVAIESATKIPAVAAQEKAIKAKIKSVAEDYGVQPLLDRIVQDVT
ncbi:MAG: hypothetical protein WC205_16860 [Opitutaceae bacterium]|jgi:hypothetical protein